MLYNKIKIINDFLLTSVFYCCIFVVLLIALYCLMVNKTKFNMKAKDVKEFEIGEHCFGEILRVNGTNYEDLTKEEILELITDMFENDINSSSLIRDAFKNSLEYLPFDCVDSSSDSCEQCGNWNHYGKFILESTEHDFC